MPSYHQNSRYNESLYELQFSKPKSNSSHQPTPNLDGIKNLKKCDRQFPLFRFLRQHINKCHYCASFSILQLNFYAFELRRNSLIDRMLSNIVDMPDGTAISFSQNKHLKCKNQHSFIHWFRAFIWLNYVFFQLILVLDSWACYLCIICRIYNIT